MKSFWDKLLNKPSFFHRCIELYMDNAQLKRELKETKKVLKNLYSVLEPGYASSLKTNSKPDDKDPYNYSVLIRAPKGASWGCTSYDDKKTIEAFVKAFEKIYPKDVLKK